MSRNLLIVESGGKIKKLREILGPQWIVKASVGHIRELASDGEHALGFEFDQSHIHCRFVPRGEQGKEVIEQIRAAVKQADKIYLATDPDREGECIAWHIQQALNLKDPQRVTYTEITAEAVKSAIANPRTIDNSLVSAGLCRTVLDKLIGFTGSPILWSIEIGASSLGRVQSAVLHLLAELEDRIQAFIPKDYWSIHTTYEEGFKAFYQRTATTTLTSDSSNDAADLTHPLEEQESDPVNTQAEADRIIQTAKANHHQVHYVHGEQEKRTPPPPFITSTLQQAVGAKLKWSPEMTMKQAQELYEKGLITYMRTDSIQLSNDFCLAAKQWLEEHDPTNIPSKSTRHRNLKSAQEAHEAIRPTNLLLKSGDLRSTLSSEQFELYAIIWKRAIASQCAPALLRKTQVLIQAGDTHWKASGQLIEFQGYLKYWNNVRPKTELPAVQLEQVLTPISVQSTPKQTKPPDRLSEAELVRAMELRGIGRPSTYATTIERLKHWKYVESIEQRLQPSALGMQVDRFLRNSFQNLIQCEFTSDMETALDRIANGEENWETWLTNWIREDWEPTITKARALALQYKSECERDKPPVQPSQTERKRSKTRCPECQSIMVKVPSRNIKKGHFLKCEACKESVLFWNETRKRWEKPYSKSPKSKTTEAPPPAKTEYKCPVCSNTLETYHYEREGHPKQLLRCSSVAQRSQPDHQNAVYFHTVQGWWSPTYGSLSPITPTLPHPKPHGMELENSSADGERWNS